MEYWKNIEGYENYQVSNLGRIKSLSKEINHGNYIEFSPEKLISTGVQTSGYNRCVLSLNGRKKYLLVHRLVAAAFLENTENKKEVNHKNGIRTDNRIENLEWVTTSENHIHAFRVLSKKHPKHQKGKIGELCAHAKKVYCPTLQISFPSLKIACEQMGISKTSLSEACLGKINHIRGLTFKYI